MVGSKVTGTHDDMTEKEYYAHMLGKLEEVQIVFEAHEQKMTGGDPVTACTKDMFSYIYMLLYDTWRG
jgi:hypothetical protein